MAETVFTLAAQAADFAPAPFAAMVKVIAETGKTIVQALKVGTMFTVAEYRLDDWFVRMYKAIGKR